MKRMLSLIAVGVMLMGHSTFAQDASRHALAEELLTAMDMQKTTESCFSAMKTNMTKVQASVTQAMGESNVSVFSIPFYTPNKITPA